MEVLQELPIIDMTDTETDCCPRFHAEDWDEKTFIFDNMKFAKASTKSFMYMPLNFGKVMKTSMEAINSSDASDPDRYLIMSQDVSMWKADHYFKVMKEVPGMDMVTLDGKFIAKSYTGEYKDVPKLINEFEAYLKTQGQLLERSQLFIFYTTCPQCAKHYGVNYMVMFAKV